MRALRSFLASMAGRMFLILLFGMLLAGAGAVALTGLKAQRDYERGKAQRTGVMQRSLRSLQTYVAQLDRSSGAERDRLWAVGGTNVHIIEADREFEGWHSRNKEFQAMLASQPGPLSKATTMQTSRCESVKRLASGRPASPMTSQKAEKDGSSGGYCILVRLALSDGTPVRLVVTERSSLTGGSSAMVVALFFGVLVLAMALLAYGVARLASKPLDRLSDAASRLGEDLHREPIKVSGPSEVRRAAAAFNAMQQRLQRHMGERTHMLAAITHDLQTPLTRLRLRLEKVEDVPLRDKLVADLGAMQALIREGLDLARSVETSENRAPLDLDSVLESLVADAAEAGGQAVFLEGCGSVLELRPLAVRRLFSNLIDNALKYACSVEVLVTREQGGVVVSVRDRGPGLPEDQLEAVFEPFHRIELSRSRDTGGAGLGLTIARALAEKNGATLVLRNREGGGLEALVRWPEDRAVAASRFTLLGS